MRGNNSYGQAADRKLGDRTDFEQIKALEKYKAHVIKYVSGGWHAHALLDNGTVLAWGYNLDGRAGIASTEHVYEPEMIKINEYIVDVSDGEWHTLLLTNKGQVYAVGLNNNMALGSDQVKTGTIIAIRGLSNVKKMYNYHLSTCSIVRTYTNEIIGWGPQSNELKPFAEGVYESEGCNFYRLHGMEHVSDIIIGERQVVFLQGKTSVYAVKRHEKFSDVFIVLQH
jgi:alpha-tubulin suppressor-like RCC1 family protein